MKTPLDLATPVSTPASTSQGPVGVSINYTYTGYDQQRMDDSRTWDN